MEDDRDNKDNTDNTDHRDDGLMRATDTTTNEKKPTSMPVNMVTKVIIRPQKVSGAMSPVGGWARRRGGTGRHGIAGVSLWGTLPRGGLTITRGGDGRLGEPDRLRDGFEFA